MRGVRAQTPVDAPPPRVLSLSLSPHVGTKKHNVDRVTVAAAGGIDGDAHAQTDRPISLLPSESFAKVAHPDLDVRPGDFAENITTIGLDFSRLRIGTRLWLGSPVELEVIQIGKECHRGCIIRQLVGDCIMPREGVFARILAGGQVHVGDTIRTGDQDESAS